jgi:hypothetical protein
LSITKIKIIKLYMLLQIFLESPSFLQTHT